MTRWNGQPTPTGERLRLSKGAAGLYGWLCDFAASRGSLGLLDLTYGQLQRARGVPERQVLDDTGAPVFDAWGGPERVNDPEWGEGIRTLQRTLRELAGAGFVEIGYRVNRECGGHRLCVQLGGPDWFCAEVESVRELGRSKGGRKSRPTPAPQPSRRGPSRQELAAHCEFCDPYGVVNRADDLVVWCDHLVD